MASIQEWDKYGHDRDTALEQHFATEAPRSSAENRTYDSAVRRHCYKEARKCTKIRPFFVPIRGKPFVVRPGEALAA